MEIVQFVPPLAYGDDLFIIIFYGFIISIIWAVTGRCIWAIYAVIIKFISGGYSKKTQENKQGGSPDWPVPKLLSIKCPHCNISLPYNLQCPNCKRTVPAKIRRSLITLYRLREQCLELKSRGLLEHDFSLPLHEFINQQIHLMWEGKKMAVQPRQTVVPSVESPLVFQKEVAPTPALETIPSVPSPEITYPPEHEAQVGTAQKVAEDAFTGFEKVEPDIPASEEVPVKNAFESVPHEEAKQPIVVSPKPIVSKRPIVSKKPIPSKPAFDFNKWLKQPIVYENVLWFLSSFLIVAGVVYFITSLWNRMSSLQRPFVLSGSLLGMALFFFFSGRFLLTRFHLKGPCIVLYTLGVLMTPFTFIPLGDLLTENLVLSFIGSVLALAAFYPIVSLAAKLYDEKLYPYLPLTFLPFAFLQSIVPWIAGQDWMYNVSMIYIVIIGTLATFMYMMKKKLPPLATGFYTGLIGAALICFLGHWQIRRMGLGIEFSVAVYGPAVLAIAWLLALLRPSIPIASIGERPTHPCVVMGFVSLVLGITLATADQGTLKAFMLITIMASFLLSCKWTAEYKRTYFLGMALLLGLSAYFMLGWFVKQNIKEYLISIGSYHKGRKIPISYYGLVFLPYLAVVSYYGQRFLKKAQESFYKLTWIWLLIFSSTLVFFANFLHKGDYRAPMTTLPVFGLGFFCLARLLKRRVFLYLGSISFAMTLLNAGIVLKVIFKANETDNICFTSGVLWVSMVGFVWWILSVVACRSDNRKPMRAVLMDTSLLLGVFAILILGYYGVRIIDGLERLLSSNRLSIALFSVGFLWYFLTLAYRVSVCSVISFLSITGGIVVLAHQIFPRSPSFIVLFLGLWSILLSVKKLEKLHQPTEGLLWLPRPGIESIKPFSGLLLIYSIIIAMLTYSLSSIMVLSPNYSLCYLILLGIAFYFLYLTLYTKKAGYTYISAFVLHQCVLLSLWYFSEYKEYWHNGLLIPLQSIYVVILCTMSSYMRERQIGQYLSTPLYNYGSIVSIFLLLFLIISRSVEEGASVIVAPFFGVIASILIGPVQSFIPRQKGWTLGVYSALTGNALLLIYILDYFNAGNAVYPLALAILSTIYAVGALAVTQHKKHFIHMATVVGLVALILIICIFVYDQQSYLHLLTGIFLVSTAAISSLVVYPKICIISAFLLLISTYYFILLQEILKFLPPSQSAGMLVLLGLLLLGSMAIKGKEIKWTWRGQSYSFPVNDCLETAVVISKIGVTIAICISSVFLIRFIEGDDLGMFWELQGTFKLNALILVGITLLLQFHKYGKETLVIASALALGFFTPFGHILKSTVKNAFILPDIEFALLGAAIAFLKFRRKFTVSIVWAVVFGLFGIMLTKIDTTNITTPLTFFMVSFTAILFTLDTKESHYFYGAVVMLLCGLCTSVFYVFPVSTLFFTNLAVTSVFTALLAMVFFVATARVERFKDSIFYWKNIKDDFNYSSIGVNIIAILLVIPPFFSFKGRLDNATAMIYLMALVLAGINLVIHALRTDNGIFVYIFESLLFIGYIFIRSCTYYLDGLPKEFDPYFTVIFGMTFLYLSAAAKEKRSESFKDSLWVGALLYPGASIFLVPFEISASNAGLLTLMAIHYGIISMTKHNRGFAIFSAVLANCALFIYWRTLGVVDPQFYGIPLGLTMIMFAEFNKKDLSHEMLQLWRFIGLIIIYFSAGIQVFQIESPKYAFMLGTWALIGIFAGLKFGNPLYWITSTVVLVMDVIGHLIATRGMKDPISAGALLLTIGLAVMGLNIHLHIKRKSKDGK